MRKKRRRYQSSFFFVEEVGEYVRQWCLFEFLFIQSMKRMGFYIVRVQVVNALSLWIRNNNQWCFKRRDRGYWVISFGSLW